MGAKEGDLCVEDDVEGEALRLDPRALLRLRQALLEAEELVNLELAARWERRRATSATHGPRVATEIRKGSTFWNVPYLYAVTTNSGI
jgi:hypothetical protein